MTFTDKLSALAEVNTAAQTQYVEAVTPARDAYVLTVDAFAAAERAWLADIINDDLAAQAQTAWQQLGDARKAMIAKIKTAAAARDATLQTAWDQLRAT